MKTKTSQHNRFLRIIALPFRALGKARDAYVKSMMNYADRVGSYSNKTIPIPSTSSYNSGLTKSFSVASTRSYGESEDFRELLRVASARSIKNSNTTRQVDSFVKYHDQQNMKKLRKGSSVIMPRSASVAMGRIDEDSPSCYFDDDDEEEEDNCGGLVGVKSDINRIKYPRSRSHGGKIARN